MKWNLFGIIVSSLALTISAFAANNSDTKIIALSPSAGEMLEAAGVKDNLIAVAGSNYSNTTLKYKPSLQSTLEAPDEAELKKFNADVFVGNADLFRKASKTANFYNIPYGALQRIPTEIEQLGQKFGDAKVAELEAAKLRGILARYEKVPFVAVLGVKGKDYVVAGSDSFVAQVWQMVGGENVIKKPGWPVVTLAELRRLNPKLLIEDNFNPLLKKDLPNAKLVNVDPNIFYHYSPVLIEQGLPEAQKIIEQIRSGEK